MALARVEERGDRVLAINMNVTRRGALSDDFYHAMIEALERAAQPHIRGVIITAEGGYFCAGGDLNAIIKRRSLSDEERSAGLDRLLHKAVRLIRDCPVPVIAAVEGGAAGAGLSIALACDLIVASEGAKFIAAYVKAGLVPDGGLTAHLARTLPRPLAMEMCLLARPVLAEQMAALGVVNQVVPAGEADAAAHALVDALARGPRRAQGVIRSVLSQAYESAEAEQLDRERDTMAHAIGAPEAGEGIAAFLEKRPPDFKT